MGTTLVTGPASEPLSLAEAKAHLREDNAHNDEMISYLITAAREYVENDTRRVLVTQTWDLTLDYDLPKRIVVPKPPLQSVTSINYVDTAGVTQTLASSQYLVNTSAPKGVIEPAYGVTWPSVRNQMSAVTVRLVAGYTAVPEPIVMAMKLMIAHWYENTDAVVTGTITSELPLAVEALLFPYRVF